MDNNKKQKIDLKRCAIAGATGAVGLDLLTCLSTRSHLFSAPTLYASPSSSGRVIENAIFGPLTIQTFSVAECIKQEFDIIFLCVSGTFSETHAPMLTGAVPCEEQPWPSSKRPYLIDNSSAFRYDPKVPLVIPEINFHSIKALNSRLIANPNCTTAILLMAIKPLHDLLGIKRLLVSTYQAASGAGIKGIAELTSQAAEVVRLKGSSGGDGKTLGFGKGEGIFSEQLAFNVIPHIDQFLPNGYTKEEMKVVWETRKIMELPDLKVSCTAVRVPCLRSHSESIVVETEKVVVLSELITALKNAPGVDVVDNITEHLLSKKSGGEIVKPLYPMPINSSGKDNVEVGRIRMSEVFDNGVEMFVAGDQILRGAALNAVLIAVKLEV